MVKGCLRTFATPFNPYDITRALTHVALGYAYEKGYVTDEPNLDKAVYYYQTSHQYIEQYKKNLEPVLLDYVIDDEGLERLEAFQYINNHGVYKEGYTESTTTSRPNHTAFPQNAIRLAVEEDGKLQDTTIYDWHTIEQAIANHQTLRLTWYTRYLSISDKLRNIISLYIQSMPNNTYCLTLSGYHYYEGYELDYEALLSKEEVLTLLHTLYREEKLSALTNAWHIVEQIDEEPYHYVLDVDNTQFLLDNYNDVPAMIRVALEGIKSKQYKRVNIRTHDFVGPSYFIFPGNTTNPYKVQLFLKDSPITLTADDGENVQIPGKSYLFESYVNNDITLNYWIHNTMTTLDIPDLSNWNQLKVPKQSL